MKSLIYFKAYFHNINFLYFFYYNDMMNNSIKTKSVNAGKE